MKVRMYCESASERDSRQVCSREGGGVGEVNAFAKRRSLSSISRWQEMVTVRGSERACCQILRRSSKGRRGKSVNVSRGAMVVWSEGGREIALVTRILTRQ